MNSRQLVSEQDLLMLACVVCGCGPFLFEWWRCCWSFMHCLSGVYGCEVLRVACVP